MGSCMLFVKVPSVAYSVIKPMKNRSNSANGAR